MTRRDVRHLQRSWVDRTAENDRVSLGSPFDVFPVQLESVFTIGHKHWVFEGVKGFEMMFLARKRIPRMPGEGHSFDYVRVPFQRTLEVRVSCETTGKRTWPPPRLALTMLIETHNQDRCEQINPWTSSETRLSPRQIDVRSFNETEKLASAPSPMAWLGLAWRRATTIGLLNSIHLVFVESGVRNWPSIQTKHVSYRKKVLIRICGNVLFVVLEFLDCRREILRREHALRESVLC